MVRDPFAPDRTPDLQAVLDALDDPDSRTIVKTLDRPMTANELSEACEIPLSTTYRKLERLVDASLLNEVTELRADGHHTTRYELAFEEVRITLDEDQSFTVAITRPERSPDEQLADLWKEMRRET